MIYFIKNCFDPKCCFGSFCISGQNYAVEDKFLDLKIETAYNESIIFGFLIVLSF